MAQKSDTNAITLFVDLQRFAQSGDYEKALKVSNKILQQFPKDEKAFHCKVVSLIQLGKFEDVLQAIKRSPDLGSELLFEKAYCEYRLNRNQESMKSLQKADPNDTRCQELYAQVLYRMEQYKESLGVYRSLVKNTQDDFDEERQTNLAAVLSALQSCTLDNVEKMGLREDTYELSYNAACYHIGKGEYEEAVMKLHEAERLCREHYADDPDTTEEEIDGELGVIRVQMGFALQKMGKVEEATKLYNLVSKQRPSDMALNAVVSNNIVTVNKDQNVFDSKKKMKTATMDSLQQKLTSSQKRTISINQCLLYMYTNQGEQCIRTAKSLQKQYPNTNTPTLIQAAQLVREKRLEQAVQALQAQVEKCTDGMMTLKLTLAQLHLCQGHVHDACSVLGSLGDYSFKPGVVSARVALFMSLEDRDSAADVLAEATTWYKHNQCDSPQHVRLIQANADFLLRAGRPEDATNMLELLHKRDPSNLKILARLISAYSKFDPEKAQLVSRKLPAPDDLSQDVDVDSLETSVNVFSSKSKKPTPLSPLKGVNEELLEKRKRHKKKKIRLPKNYDPKAPIDPERWLPLRERSYYRSKRQRKRDVGRGTQGAAAANPDLDMASQHGTTPRSPGSSNTANTPTSPTQARPKHGPSSKARRKKRGGAKW